MPLSPSDLSARLGTRIAALQDEPQPEPFDLERARARLLRAYPTPRASPTRGARARRAARWGLTALAAGACCVLVVLLRQPPALQYRLGASDEAGQAGDWIAPPSQERLPIHFSDGTELALAGGTRARIVDVEATGATVIVERGELHASVVHTERTRWQVFIGPYRVRVTGTRFDVAWRPEDERFSLALQTGSVLVSGPGIDGERTLRAGEQMVVGRVGGALPQLGSEPSLPSVPSALATSPGELEPASSTPAPDVTPAPRARSSAERRTAPRRATPPTPPTGAEDFRQLATASRYPEALAAAERAGFGQLCRTLGQDDVLLLADVARLAGAPGLARSAYRAVRERFPGRDAGQAAFFLGRLASDRDANYAEAARQFELSLAEGPGGPLAREAAGRLLEARIRQGDEASARRAAHDYLERFPSGPHAALARGWAGGP